MSVVTGVTIITNCCDDDNMQELVEKINEWIASDPGCGGGRLFRIDPYYGGRAHPECLAWGGGFNYLSWKEFIEYVKSLAWKENFTDTSENRAVLIVSPDQRPMEVHVLGG